MSKETKNGEQNQERTKKKPKKWLWAVAVLVLIIAFASASGNDDGTEVEPTGAAVAESGNDELQQNKEPQDEIPGTLGFTPEEFKERFNMAAREFESDLQITYIKIEEGPAQDVFNYMLTENLGVVGTVNKKDGSIRDVMILGQGDGTFKSGVDILTSMGILIAAVNPEISANDRGNILKELGIIGENVDVLSLDGKTIRNGKKYWVSSSKELGIMFGVGDVND